MYDLIVIGGGPAGGSAAITAAKAGAKVLLLERGKFPRHKVCGEFVSAESLNLLNSLLHSEYKTLLSGALRLSKCSVFVDGRRIELPLAPAAASIARFNLDEALFDSARRNGIDARQQVIVQNITVQNITRADPFRVATSAGEFESRVVINATGRWSNLNAHPNGSAKSKWLGVKGHFAERAASTSVDLYFFKDGYCGVQPVTMKDGENRVNVCAMVRGGTASKLEEVFPRHPLLLERSKSWSLLSDPVSTFPLLFSASQPVRDGVLLAGDAAAFVDPFIGDGISLALRSGALAAGSLAAVFRQEVSREEAIDNYRKVYLQQIAPVFKASYLVRKALRMPGFLRLPLTYLLGNSPTLAAYLVKRTR